MKFHFISKIIKLNLLYHTLFFLTNTLHSFYFICLSLKFHVCKIPSKKKNVCKIKIEFDIYPFQCNDGNQSILILGREHLYIHAQEILNFGLMFFLFVFFGLMFFRFVFSLLQHKMCIKQKKEQSRPRKIKPKTTERNNTPNVVSVNNKTKKIQWIKLPLIQTIHP